MRCNDVYNYHVRLLMTFSMAGWPHGPFRGIMAVLLATICSAVRGVKFYELAGGGGWFWERGKVVRDPNNFFDDNCVEVVVRGRKLGHLAREAAEFVSPLPAAFSMASHVNS